MPKSRFLCFTQFHAFCTFRTDLGKLWLVGAHQTYKQTANIAKFFLQSPTQLTDDVHLLGLGLGLGLSLDLFLSFLSSCLLAGLVLLLVLVFWCLSSGTCLLVLACWVSPIVHHSPWPPLPLSDKIPVCYISSQFLFIIIFASCI